MAKLLASAVIWIPILLFGKEILFGIVAIVLCVLIYGAYLLVKMFFERNDSALSSNNDYQYSNTAREVTEYRFNFADLDAPKPKSKPSTMPSSDISSGLIVDEPWISMILSGQKSWEMRSTASTKRGRIALIKKGSKTIVGVANMVDSLGPFDDQKISENIHRHGVSLSQIGKWRHAWVLEDVRRLRRAVPYVHPNGAVKWVKLDAETSRQLAEQIL